MKKRFTRIMAAMMLLVTFAIPMGMRGQTSVTWPGTTALPGTATAVANDQNVTIKTSSTNTYTNPIRIYANTTVTINALNGAKILSVAYEASSTGNYVTYAQNATVSPSVTPTVNGKIVTWTYAESANVTEFTFKPGSQTRSNGITITYKTSGSTPTCATPTFSPAAGDYYTAQNVTISTTTEGATIRYTLDGSTPTTSSSVYSTPLSIGTNTTVKAIAMKDGFVNSSVAEATYNFLTASFNQDWEGATNGWSFVSVTGDQVWSVASYSGNHYAKMSGYSGGNFANEDWCISPAFNLGDYTNPVLTFTTARSNHNGNDLEVYFSNNYDGTNVSSATWTQLTCTLPAQPSSGYTAFTSSGEIDLSSYTGTNCYIGFKYTSTTSAAVTWELDDIVLASQTYTPVITFNPSSINLGDNNAVGEEISKSFTVSQNHLTNGIALSATTGTLSLSSIAQGADDTEVTWTYTPTEAGNISATITATSAGAETQTLTITGAAVAPVTGDRYEMVTEALQDWSGCYIITGTNSSHYYALTGVASNLGTTAVVTVVGNSIESNSTTDGYQVIVAPTTNGYSLYMDGVGYLGYDSDATSGSNNLHALESFKANTCEWTIAMTDGLATITNVRNTGRTLQFNYNNGNPRFACYTSNQVKPTLFKYTGTVVLPPVINVTNNTVSLEYDATSGEIAYTIDNPVTGTTLTATTTASWISDITVASDKVTFTTTANNGNSDRTATITLSYNGANDKEISVTQGHYVAPFEGGTYTLATSITSIVSGKTYIIVGEYEGDYYAMGEQKNNNRGAYTISVDGTTATVETADVHEVVITALTGDDAGKYTIEDGGYLYAASSSSNHLKTKSELDDDGKWTIVIENGVATITAQGDNTRNLMRFNPNNGTPIFACYATTSTTGSLPKLYVKNEPVTESITLSVPGYGNSAGGYHLIASPLATSVAPTAVTNMIDATPANYDLYRFNQDEDYEWQNYKRHTDGFVIEPGKAYLYAHNTDVTLTFNGTAYNGNGTFTLTQSATNTSNGGKMNAIGNPFNTTASIGSRSFYKMNADGTALEAVVGETIGALEGIVVNYDANNPTVTFSTSKSRDVIELLTLNLQEQDNVIDNVIVRFDGGDQLLKYQIFDSSKIYVTVDGEDYAVVRGENQGTLPVNFVALSNGTYTISMDFENMTFSYLHLIDNLTGEDIDMLTTTSYSFDATTEDDANRFTLVYSKDGEGTTETLTFYDGDATSGYVPVYGFYADAYQKVEFIMPAEDLYALTGATINKMTWYLTTPAEAAWGGNFKIYLMETEATTPTDYANLTNATLVYDGPLDGTGETLEINFATSFFYEGNNLLVAVHQTETGTYKSATFAGSAVTGAALQGYNYSNLNQVNQAVRDFLPKTTFEFTPGSGAIYYKPKQLQASEIGITSAVLTWEAGDDETSWGVEYKKVTEDTWTDAGTVDQLTITLDNLEAGTEYEAHVKSIYTDGESGWTTIAFATEACEETDKGEVAYTLTDTYGDGWTNNKLRIFLSGTDIMIAELTLTTGSELEGVVKLCYDTDYDLVWVAGNYAYETGFVLTAPDGTIIYEFHGTGNSGGTTPTPGVLTTFQIHNGFTKTIEAYTDNSGYYLIASPVGNVLASEVTNMVDGNYDLYMFDQNGDDEGKQWLNYKANAFSYLEVGIGYLYASESDVTLTFSGTPISSDDDYTVEVNYNASSDFPGLNLLGNPFAKEAYLVNAEGNGLAYHRLNPANNTYVTVDDNSAIPMMEGVFYEAGENDDVVYFSATAPATSKSNLNITVSQGRGMVDNAIVRFGEGNTLRKISLRDNSTKVYIPQNGSEYALVNANEFGEMPVNFKAESNGTYTMSFSNQNVEFGYLHLIDNLTGADVDLLANPSYSFEAKVSDYASRFKLVFATGNDDSSSDFAFVSNDEIIVNGEGMLQVIDMTGRIISTSQVNGMSSIKLNAAAGVYVLRLNDKTQKIVIR